MKKTFHKKTFVIVLSLGLTFCLVLPGFSAGGKSENEPDPKQTKTLELEPLVFRIASSEQSGEKIFPLFSITHKNLSIQNLHFSTGKNSGEISPQPLNRTSKIAIPLGNSLYTVSLLTLTALNIADTISTVKAIQLPGLEEGNPIMRPFTKNMIVFSAVKLGVIVLDYCLLKNIYKKNKTLGWVLSIAGNIAMSYVVSNNMRKIQSVTR